jgi:predicted transcriptional regulator
MKRERSERPDDVRDAARHWEHENQTEEERQETQQAIRQGLADIEAGRMRPFEDFDREFRKKHGLRSR